MWKIWRRIIGSGRSIKVSVKEFQTLVATGEVKHVAGLAAWARWMSREDEKIMEDHGLVSYNTDKYQEDRTR